MCHGFHILLIGKPRVGAECCGAPSRRLPPGSGTICRAHHFHHLSSRSTNTGCESHSKHLRGAAPILQAGNLGQGITAAWMKGLAYAGTCLIPSMGIAAAFVSFVRQRKDKALFEQVKAAPSPHTLNGQSWQQFERLVEAAHPRGCL